MQYTTQQLQGGPAFSHKTRIGNWNEDYEMHSIKTKDYDGRRANETLPFNTTLNKVEHSFKKVPLTFAQDGLMRNGTQFMMRSAATSGFLAVDVGSEQKGVRDSCKLSSAPCRQGPSGRNVFGIKRVDKVDIFGSDDIVRFGQKVRIEANPHLYKKTLVLGSTTHHPSCHSELSHNQEASMHTQETFNMVWIVDAVDPNNRFERQGEPIPAGETILLRHAQTGHYLATDPKKSFKNDFGTEFEVSAHSFNTINKTQNLHLEMNGQATSDVPCRFQGIENQWSFETAPTADYDRPIEELGKVSTEELVMNLRHKVLDQSHLGLRRLTQIFKRIDKHGDGGIDLDDFRWAFIDYGFQVGKEDAAKVLEAFDKDGNGVVDLNEFTSAMKGKLGAAREQIIFDAFNKVADGKNSVSITDLADMMNCDEEERQQRCEAMDLDDNKMISHKEFKEFHWCLSANFENDDKFCETVKTYWNM